jgi:hypothetical protein
MDIQRLLNLPQRISESSRSQSTALQLRAGDQIQASVLDVFARNDALLSFGPFKAYARMPYPVVTGQQVRIHVTTSGSDLRLLMVPNGASPASLSADDRSEIRLFEPVSDRPSLAAQSHALTPGDTLKGRITGFERDGLHLVDFGRFKAFTKIDIPVRQGQLVPLTVLKSDDGLALTVSPGANRSSAAGTLPPVPVDRMADGQIKAAAVGARNEAAHQSPLPPQPTHSQALSGSGSGGHLSSPTSADMVLLGKQIQHLLEGVNPAGQASPLSLPAPLAQALANLQQIINPTSAVGDIEQLAARIKDFIDNSGLYFEKRMETAIQGVLERPQSLPADQRSGQTTISDVMRNDLKPNLLKIRQFLDGQPLDVKAADRPILEILKPMVQRSLFNIEQQQTLATEKPGDTETFQAFSHLLMLSENPRNARLNVYYAKKGRDDAHKTPRVSLLLEMDRMGAVRTDLWMVDNNLNITFFVQQEDIKSAIDAESRHIHEMLGELFNTVGISVVVNQKKIDDFDGEDLSVPNQGQVDLNI